MNARLSRTSAALALAALIAGCGEDPVGPDEDLTQCVTTWVANTEWQQLCTPAAGSVRHVRLEGVSSTSNNSYFYVILGQDPSPSGNPAPGPGKLIVTGGRSNSGASWTWFRFGDGSTTQFTYTTDAGAALYTDAPATICFDIGTNPNGTARLVFWATGANGADCENFSTLTLANALYDSAADPETGDIWNAPYVQGKLNFIKTNNAFASIGEAVVSSEAAAL